MYHSHFGLREEPFGATPDPRFFYCTPQHREAVATTLFAIQQRRGLALLVGPPGLGKTSTLFTVVRMLKGSAQVAYLPNPCYDRSTVLESILASFGLEPVPSPVSNQRLFYQYLLKTRQEGKNCVVIFDEAQDLDRDTLEGIRLLSNYEIPEGKLVQIVLAGQPRLAETLEHPDCEQIRQRINARTCLQPLSRSEVAEYMTHRLNAAGAGIDVFAPAAVEAIAKASGGIPRNVNSICFNALALTYALERRQVGAAEIGEVCRDLGLPAGMRPDPAAFRLSVDLDLARRSLRPAYIAMAVGLMLAGAFAFRGI
jgi:type II secretory pathway predicted ATPase ExeA